MESRADDANTWGVEAMSFPSVKASTMDTETDRNSKTVTSIPVSHVPVEHDA